MLQGPIDESGFECQEVPRPWHGKAEVLADLGAMFTAGLLTAGVALKRLRADFELVGDETDGGLRSHAQIRRNESEVAKCAQLESQAQAIRRPPAIGH